MNTHFPSLERRLRVGCVDYINALPISLPFRQRRLGSELDFIYSTPTQLSHLLAQGALDVALTSSVTHMDGNYGELPDFGIASCGAVFSVNLYTQVPISYLNKARIGLTEQSATSIALLKVLCQHFWHISPRFEPLNREESLLEYDALLLIGDEALKQQQLARFQTIDLGLTWYEMTGLPFVFALFSLHSEVNPKAKDHVHQQIEAALQWSEKHKAAIQREALQRCSIAPQRMKKYFSQLYYRLGETDYQSLARFKILREML